MGFNSLLRSSFIISKTFQTLRIKTSFHCSEKLQLSIYAVLCHPLSGLAPAWNGPRVNTVSSHTCCPQLQAVVWSLVLPIKKPSNNKSPNKKKKKKKILTLPSAPSSTPSSPSTISVETETPPEGCRCFCPSIFRSLNVDKKIHYWKMQCKPRFLYNKHQVQLQPTPPGQSFMGEQCNPSISSPRKH